MNASVHRDAPFFPLFVPANRLKRLDRAAQSGADAVVIDLEDAVAEEEKESARCALSQALTEYVAPIPLMVRINEAGSRHFEADLALMAGLDIAGIMLPKAELSVDVDSIRNEIGRLRVVVALVETARGLADARSLAQCVDRLAFGSIDYSEAIGATEQSEALLTARSEFVLAAALASAPAPIDGITRSFDNEAQVEGDAGHAFSLGMGGKLLIHPAQLAPAIRGFAPDPVEVEQARALLAQADGNAGKHRGAMVDRPVIASARRKVEALQRAKERLSRL